LSLLLKNPSVRVADPNYPLDPHILFALGVAAQAYSTLCKDCVITSAFDGHHNPGSLHLAGRAVDIRTLQLNPAERTEIFNTLKSLLTPLGFDVIWEAAGATPATTAQHIHIEYDPNGRPFWKVAG